MDATLHPLEYIALGLVHDGDFKTIFRVIFRQKSGVIDEGGILTKQRALHAASDEVLAHQTRLGDTRAFSLLWERHVRPGYAAARHFGSIADPDDIVAESYLRIFQAMQSGGGPKGAFRPYLYRTIRNVALSWKTEQYPVPLDEATDVADDKIDIETSTLENTITVKAFRTLPERWKDILWYSEIEGMDNADIAPLLGLTPTATAALAYRAREGLKKAWLQAHVSDKGVPHDCRWTTERMGDYSSGALTAKATKRFVSHLPSCARCSILVEEVDEISGRLAAFLLPAVLGGSVGASLLADLRVGRSDSDLAKAPKNSTALSRKILISATSAVVASGIAAGIVVAAVSMPTAQLQHNVTDFPETESTAPKFTESKVEPVTTEIPIESPTDTPVVVPPAEYAAPPTTPPGSGPAPHTTPPAAPAVASPAHGLLTSHSSPVFAGTGEAGAVVEVWRPSGSGFETIASVTVQADNSWTAISVTPLPDGPVTLHISQVDNAGNRSDPVLLDLVIDTIALAPVLNSPGPGPYYFLPVISGESEPFALVELLDEADALITSVSSDVTGAWSILLPDPIRDDQQVFARQTDQVGNMSPLTSPLGSIDFERPVIVSPSSDDTFPTTSQGMATPITVEISGVEGMQVEILIDEISTGNLHTLTDTSITRITAPLPAGSHIIGVRYTDADGHVGSITNVEFTII